MIFANVMKNNVHRPCNAIVDAFKQFQSGLSGHFYINEKEIGLMFQNKFPARLSCNRFPHNTQFGVFIRDGLMYGIDASLFVIDNYNSKFVLFHIGSYMCIDSDNYKQCNGTLSLSLCRAILLFVCVKKKENKWCSDKYIVLFFF